MLHLSHVFGQQEEFIKGRLIDTNTEEPIPFASIRVKNKAKGLISNFDGGFKIPLKLQGSGDTLEISSLGYKSKVVLLSNLGKSRINIIRLFEEVELLNEVVVSTSKRRKRPGAKRIIRRAISKIPQNLPFFPFSYVGYYRDYQFKEGDYLNLNEAVLEVVDPGFDFDDLRSTKIRIYRYEENLDFPRDTVADKPYNYINKSKVIPHATLEGKGGNEYTLLRLHDAIRNYNINTYDFVNRFDMDLVTNHRFTLSDDTFLDGIPLYVIRISKTQDNVQVVGKIYIGKSNFTIHKMEYAVYDRNKDQTFPEKEERSPFVKRKDKKRLKKLLFEIIVEYQVHEERMYPNYISFNNAFEVLKPPKFMPIAAKIDHIRKRFELILNNPPLLKDAIKKEKYQLYYQERKLKIAKVEVRANSILLYPDNANVVFDQKLIQELRKRTGKGVTIQIKDVRDIYGNIVHESESISYNQFREFFVQQLMVKTEKNLDDLLMIKTKPIFQGQAVVAPKNLNDYWMNTPLKNK